MDTIDYKNTNFLSDQVSNMAWILVWLCFSVSKRNKFTKSHYCQAFISNKLITQASSVSIILVHHTHTRNFVDFTVTNNANLMFDLQQYLAC